MQTLLSIAVFLKKFSFFTVCLGHNLREHRRENFWNLGLQIAGKCISNSLSDCISIACISLINVIFSREYRLKIPPFCHICLYFFVCSGSDFCWNFRVIWEVSKKSLLERYINVPLCVFKPKIKKNRQIKRMENLSRNFF